MSSTEKEENTDTLPYLTYLQSRMNIKSSGLFIFCMILILLAGIFLLVLIIICCCCCIKQRKEAKKRPNRRKMRGLFKDELPGYDGDSIDCDLGIIDYRMEYIMNRNEFEVGVVLCRYLKPLDPTRELNPYIVLFIEYKDGQSPHDDTSTTRSKSRTSTTKYDSLNPVFNETFTFKIPPVMLSSVVLCMELYDSVKLGRHIKFAVVHIDIYKMDLLTIFDRVYEGRAYLEPCESIYDGIGEICLIIMQDPSIDQLQVTILEASKLRFPTKYCSQLPDVFVDIKLHVGKKTLEHKKTGIRHNTHDPYFSESINCSVRTSKLPLISLTCKVKYKTSLGVAKTLGYVKLGLEVVELAPRAHWHDMLEQPKRAIAMWHSLKNRTNLSGKD